MPKHQVEMLGHLQHPDEAAKEILDFIKALAVHGACYAFAAKKTLECNCLASLLTEIRPSRRGECFKAPC